MPTKEEIDRVTGEIELLVGGLEVVLVEEKHSLPASDPRRVLFWDDLRDDHRRDALAVAIDWTGFTEAQRDDVIRRVLDGEEPDFWMDGIEADAPAIEPSVPHLPDVPADVVAVDVKGAHSAGSRPVYDDYEISGCCRIDDAGRPNPEGLSVEPCGDVEAHFWTIYGHIHGQGAEAIGDFPSREAAEEVFYRITGQPFTGSREAHDRLRLMHAAPLLLEALEPYAIEAINLMQMAKGEDNEDVVDHIASKSVHAYTQATPRPPGADAVTRQIDRLLKAGYLEDWDDSNKVCPDFAGLNASYIPQRMLAWEGLDRSQQEQVLDRYVHWDGFDHSSADRVVRNILGGRPREEWFSGLTAPIVAEAGPGDSSQAGNTTPSPGYDVLPDVRTDVLDALMSRMEAFGDEFERLAQTQEQKNLAASFSDLVSEVHSAIKYIVEETHQNGPTQAGIDGTDQAGALDLAAHTEQLNRIYETNGRDGLRDCPDEDIQLLLSTKQLELSALSEQLESRQGSELDVLLKGQLEIQVTDLGAEMTMRESGGVAHEAALSPAETRGLFAEWTADYAAAKERPEDRFNAILRVEARVEKQPEQEQEKGLSR